MPSNPRKRIAESGRKGSLEPPVQAHGGRTSISSQSKPPLRNLQPRRAISPRPRRDLAPTGKHPSNMRQAKPVLIPAGEPQYHSPYKPTPASSRSTRLQARTDAPKPTICMPSVLHGPHPDSKLCQDFHWVPYPLGLLPYDSWHKLHHRPDTQPSLPFRCPVCKMERKVTQHMRKVFLIAERLTWDEGRISTHDKDMNEELNWAVNYEVGILDPFVEDPEHIPGGKHSSNSKFYPYQNEHEMMLALKLIFMTEDINETTWALWIGTQLDMQMALSGEESGPQRSASSPSTGDPNKRITSYKTLQDFYSLLDRIERTSHVGALFLEAYAEKLRDDMCRSCWFKHNVRLDVF
ncbi:hypothetical protein P153DRAFT_365860 [Dothidotthia symphoricarpi CBS 119687]|uniref:Uncharacterized protein n=1 Tax=Dothidotthia symphoricarpi CBS 119687 TaxID=1392245 RepID=A0A6A6AEJ0_9PLEO|nr:uncharacterized protein P153DRAFT_365860 [Dothidotthia symphoricarpi CBS 119687]KAF2130230.1 hypothetical protein P153DRAFT_365860 [Dothidotthia symphoricarpi CBS 119687]